MAQRVDLDHEPQFDTFTAPQLNYAIIESLPVPIANKIVVGDEEPIDTYFVVRADNFLKIVDCAKTADPTLYIDDAAERAFVRTAAT